MINSFLNHGVTETLREKKEKLRDSPGATHPGLVSVSVVRA
jgi:hypothetical protein